MLRQSSPDLYPAALSSFHSNKMKDVVVMTLIKNGERTFEKFVFVDDEVRSQGKELLDQYYEELRRMI